MKPEYAFRFCPRCGTSVSYSDNHFTCGSCGLKHYINPLPSNAALIEHDGKILFVQRAFEPCKGMLDLPGGFIDRYETAEGSVIREVKEELNLDVVSLKYINSDYNDYEYSGVTYSCLGFAFWARVRTLEGLKPQDDVASVEWLRLEDVKIEELAFEAHKRLVEMLREKRL